MAPTPLTHHYLEAEGRVGNLQISAKLAFTAPWTVLFGPSGSGKSSLLRAMCGFYPGWSTVFKRLLPPVHAEVLGDKGTWLRPELRRLAYAPQRATLFPHLSVSGNIGFSAALRRGRSRRSALPEEVAQLLQLGGLLRRDVRSLSGGERQRVSLARALAVPDARLLLLDEPFAGVDGTLRDDLLPALRAWCSARQLPVISVTHDVDEVFLLEAEVVRLRDGHATAQGPASLVLADEVDRVQRAFRITS